VFERKSKTALEQLRPVAPYGEINSTRWVWGD